MAAGADVNIPSLGGRTPLMGAAMNGHCEILKIFLAAGAELAPENDFGETALALAIAKGHTNCADLIEAKSNLE